MKPITITLKAAHLRNMLEVLEAQQKNSNSVSDTVEIELVEATETLGASDEVKFYAQSIYGDANRHYLGTVGSL